MMCCCADLNRENERHEDRSRWMWKETAFSVIIVVLPLRDHNKVRRTPEGVRTVQIAYDQWG